MHIAIELEETTLRQLLDELLPITILLDEAQGTDGRWIRIDPARELRFSVDEGIRIATSGALRWSLGPFPVTLTVQSLALLLRPLVVGTGTASRLLFRPVIEGADLQNVPDFLDRGVVGLVNRALEARSERLAWDFGRALALRFALPDTLVPLEAAAVAVEMAHLRVQADALVLIVSLTMHISRLVGGRAGDRRADAA
jgi:hypothetical protein